MTSAAARWLTVAGCAATLAVPALQLARGPAEGPFRRFAASIEGLGRTFEEDGWLAANRALLARMDELEGELERGSAVMRAALPTAQGVLSAWGGVGNEKVYLGSDGWLFLRPGVDYLTGPPFLDPAVLERRARSGESWREPPRPDPRPAILDFHRQLEGRGILLVVVPAPTKAMIYPEKLRPPAAPADGEVFHNPSFAAFRAVLEGHGVEVFDPAPALLEAKNAGDEEVFLRTDSHWSPAGLAAAAAALGERLRELGLGSTRPPGMRRVAVVHRGDGDLERMLELPEGSPWPPPEQVRLRRVAGAPEANPEAEILLLGDSFSNVFSEAGLGWGTGAGLREQLAFELGQPVASLVINDGGDTGVRRRLAREAGRLAGKRLVIYQFAVRELAVGDWRLVELAD